MPVALFLSPHLDDAIFSCPGRILAEVEQGARVVVATLFSRGGRDPQSRSEHLERRREDRQAVKLLGAEHLWMGFPDAPFRDPYYHSFLNIIFGQSPDDEQWIAKIKTRIDRVIADLSPDRIYAPLAVGNHVDHRLTYRAVVVIAARRDINFYEERPYALVPHAVAWRFGCIAPGPDVDRARISGSYWRALLRARYVRAYLPPGTERPLCRAALNDFPRGLPMTGAWKSITHSYDVSQLPTMVEAIYSYRSQTPIFIGPRARFLRASLRYARSLGESAPWAERIWRCVTTK